jgi:hypothetical protein
MQRGQRYSAFTPDPARESGSSHERRAVRMNRRDQTERDTPGSASPRPFNIARSPVLNAAA